MQASIVYLVELAEEHLYDQEEAHAYKFRMPLQAYLFRPAPCRWQQP